MITVVDAAGHRCSRRSCYLSCEGSRLHAHFMSVTATHAACVWFLLMRSNHVFAQVPCSPSCVFVTGKREREKKKKKKPTLHIKESRCRRNIPATATKTLPLCVRTSHAQLETAWRRQAVSSFLHFSIPATPLEFRLLIGSSLGRPECRLRSRAVEQKHITVTQLIGYRLVAFSFPLGNVQCFLGVLHKVQRLVRVPKKLCSCAKPNN